MRAYVRAFVAIVSGNSIALYFVSSFFFFFLLQLLYTYIVFFAFFPVLICCFFLYHLLENRTHLSLSAFFRATLLLFFVSVVTSNFILLRNVIEKFMLLHYRWLYVRVVRARFPPLHGVFQCLLCFLFPFNLHSFMDKVLIYTFLQAPSTPFLFLFLDASSIQHTHTHTQTHAQPFAIILAGRPFCIIFRNSYALLSGFAWLCSWHTFIVLSLLLFLFQHFFPSLFYIYFFA